MARNKKRGPPRWRKRFLRALGATANARGSARAAGIDHGTAYAHAKRNPAFDRAWRRAVRIAQARPPSREAPAEQGPGSPMVSADGEELVVRHSKKRGRQWVRAGRGRWNAKAHRTFIAWLRRTGTVRISARAAGFSTTALYNRRTAHADFAEEWDAAVAEATVNLNSLVVGSAIATFDPEVAAMDDQAEAVPRVTVAEAIAILRLKGGSQGGGGAAGRSARYGPPEPSIEEVRASILRRLDAIEAHEKRKQEGDPSPSPEGRGDAHGDSHE